MVSMKKTQMKIKAYEKRMSKFIGYYVLFGLIIFPKIFLFLFVETSFYWVIKIITIANFYLSLILIFSWLILDKKMHPPNRKKLEFSHKIYIFTISTLGIMIALGIPKIVNLTQDTYQSIIDRKPAETTITIERTDRNRKASTFGQQTVYTDSNDTYRLFYTNSYMKPGQTYHIQYLEETGFILNILD